MEISVIRDSEAIREGLNDISSLTRNSGFRIIWIPRQFKWTLGREKLRGLDISDWNQGWKIVGSVEIWREMRREWVRFILGINFENRGL